MLSQVKQFFFHNIISKWVIIEGIRHMQYASHLRLVILSVNFSVCISSEPP